MVIWCHDTVRVYVDRNSYIVSARISLLERDRYGKQFYKSLRESAGIRLMDILWENRMPAVVDGEERVRHGNYHGDYYDEIAYVLHVTPVDYEHIVVPVVGNDWSIPRGEASVLKSIGKWFLLATRRMRRVLLDGRGR